MRNNPIGVFDSGAGGLNVLRECRQLLPDEKYIYLADTANMPYGTKPPEQIKRAACGCCATLFSMNCKAVVIACNTATVTAIDDIRALYSTRVVVGLEPAVKPCFRELGKKEYAVALVTEATYRSDKFARLIQTCDRRIIPVAQPFLAKLIEDNVDSIDRIEHEVFDILSPYRDAGAVVLGCSHYTYIVPLIKKFYAGGIKIYDGAAGAAARLRYCLELSSGLSQDKNGGSVRFIKTRK
ncbi:MAG: glutamate racemase [Clostridia bacterium]|nr:glutamate racemase [Clostridia bacterium]